MTVSRVDAPVRWQQCAACGLRMDELDPRTACPDCNGLLDVMFHIAPGRAVELRRAFDSRVSLSADAMSVSGVWRYADLLMNVSRDDVVSFPEGNTPLISNERLSSFVGSSRILFKHEGMNPTGSFKDRGMTVGVTQAKRVRARAVACASTGNTSASLAAYAALAGLPAMVLVPAGQIASGKLQQTLAYGARTLAVQGDFDACLSLLRDAAPRLGIYLLNSINPYRVEGQKTIVFEILQQLGWKAPDWIALPAGNLGNTGAFGKALDEAHRLGLIDRVPRILAVQAAGAAPFYESFRSGFLERHATRAETVASAIRIGNPASYERGVRTIQQTNGLVMSVPDEAILEAQQCVGNTGIGCEPASATSVAGVRDAIRRGIISPEESVVAVLTGHVLKDPAIDSTDAGAHNAPVEIEASLSSIERELILLTLNR